MWEWVLEDDLLVTALVPDRTILLVRSNDGPRAVVLFYDGDSLYFNGVREETESFMGFMGLFDEVEEADPMPGEEIRLEAAR